MYRHITPTGSWTGVFSPVGSSHAPANGEQVRPSVEIRNRKLLGRAEVKVSAIMAGASGVKAK